MTDIYYNGDVVKLTLKGALASNMLVWAAFLANTLMVPPELTNESKFTSRVGTPSGNANR